VAAGVDFVHFAVAEESQEVQIVSFTLDVVFAKDTTV